MMLDNFIDIRITNIKMPCYQGIRSWVNDAGYTHRFVKTLNPPLFVKIHFSWKRLKIEGNN
ncbi:hypothetical protein Taro_017905 [Colocasia esculenta]|uniref:Uncharacterized protein n=1 Tax=Colocasia esculenta TaxID=4460 RepID=A0A843UUN4_COLES|nr:hypothetical protein [Colocasia esculenta]